MTKKRRKSTTKQKPVPVSTPQPTYPSSMSGPVAIEGVLYYVCTVPYEVFLDWRYSPLGHAEINRALRSCRAMKLWFPKSDNLILTLEKRNVGTITNVIDEAHEQTEQQ